MDDLDDVNPSQLAAEVERDVRTDGQPLRVYWVQVRSDRDAYAKAARMAVPNCPMVPIVVRHHGFDCPNSVFQDLMDIVQSERLRFEEPSFRALAQQHGRVAILLVGRSALGGPQILSPALLPDWFPVAPGEQVTAYLRDMTWKVTVPLKSSECKASSLARLLYELEGVLHDRLEEQRSRDHRCTSGLVEKLRGVDERESLEEILRKAKEYRELVSDPDGFRPSRKDRKALITRIWDLYMKNGPEQLPSCAKPLGMALQPRLCTNDTLMSLQALLMRPSNPINDNTTQWALALLISVGAGCQFLTAVAHSDQYPEYPVLILKAFSLDVRQILRDAIDVLRK